MEMRKWDHYFLGLCEAVSANVNCPSRKLGAVIARGKLLVSTGYNGPPAGFPHPGSVRYIQAASENIGKMPYEIDWSKSSCLRQAMDITSGQRLSLCPCAHAERNAIDQAAKMGHSTEGCTLYLNTCIPCLDCAYSIVNAGITEVVVMSMEEYPQEGFTGAMVLKECGVAIRPFMVFSGCDPEVPAP